MIIRCDFDGPLILPKRKTFIRILFKILLLEDLVTFASNWCVRNITKITSIGPHLDRNSLTLRVF